MPAGYYQKRLLYQFTAAVFLSFPILPFMAHRWLQAFHQPVAFSLAVMKELWVDVFCSVHTLTSYYDAYHNASQRAQSSRSLTQIVTKLHVGWISDHPKYIFLYRKYLQYYSELLAPFYTTARQRRYSAY